MSYESDITGLDLFTMPFRCSQASMAVPASSRGTARSVPSFKNSESRSRPMAPQTETQVPIQQEPDIPEKTGAVQPVKEQDPPAEGQTSMDKPESPKKELVMDMSDHVPVGKPLDASEDAKRKAHEESEAKRKVEWEAKQLAKKQAEEAALHKLQAMTDVDAVAASTECVRLAIERITRRNMKECVAGHIQELCQKDPAFARCVMHPRKSLVNCFKFINRKAKDYLKNEMEEMGIEPENGVYGGDVPDAICYEWGENYFRDPDAPEDIEREDKFVPRPYVSQRLSKAKKPKNTDKKKLPKKAGNDKGYQQMSLMEAIK